MEIALYIRHIDDEAKPYLATLTETLHRSGITTRQVTDGDSVDGCDFLFTIGGDGTLLSSVQFVHSSSPAAFPPILGINFGHLGFLTAAGKENAGTLVDELLQGHYTLEKRSLLEVNGGYALNEVFLHRSDAASLLRIEATVDGDYVATYAGDMPRHNTHLRPHPHPATHHRARHRHRRHARRRRRDLHPRHRLATHHPPRLHATHAATRSLQHQPGTHRLAELLLGHPRQTVVGQLTTNPLAHKLQAREAWKR